MGGWHRDLTVIRGGENHDVRDIRAAIQAENQVVIQEQPPGYRRPRSRIRDVSSWTWS